jgi:uncharacterized membrane protein HdeD (DUF308 family)
MTSLGTPASTDGSPDGDGLRPLPALLARISWQLLLAAAVVAIATGVVVLTWPGPSLLVVGVVFGVYLVTTGSVQAVSAFGPHVPGQLRALALVGGALSLFLGLLCFRSPVQSVFLLALWIGFGWLMRGVAQTAAAVSTPRLPSRGTQLALGLLGVVAGVVTVVSPFSSITALTLVVGIWLVVLGIVEAVHAVRLAARERHRAG